MRSDFKELLFLEGSSTSLDFDTLMEYTAYKDQDGFYYDYDLFRLGEIIRPGYIDEFYRNRRDKRTIKILISTAHEPYLEKLTNK